MDTTSEYARRALERQARGLALTGNEQRRVASLVRINYRPLGTSPEQLLDRVHSIQAANLPNPTSAANELHYNNGTVKIDIDGSGIVITRASNGKKVTIAPGSITHDMSIVTISVCDSGTTKSMDILASAPY